LSIFLGGRSIRRSHSGTYLSFLESINAQGGMHAPLCLAYHVDKKHSCTCQCCNSFPTSPCNPYQRTMISPHALPLSHACQTCILLFHTQRFLPCMARNTLLHLFGPSTQLGLPACHPASNRNVAILLLFGHGLLAEDL